MIDHPLVSFVIPCRNSALTIAPCIEAIVAQQYPKEAIEIIVVNNGSTDETADIASYYPVQVVHEYSVGRSQARNKGIRESKGQFIACIDSDTVIEPLWTVSMLQDFFFEGIGAVQSRQELLTRNPGSFLYRFRAWLNLIHQEGAHNIFNIPLPLVDTAACMYRAQVFQANQELFDPALSRCEDLDLTWRILADGWHLAYASSARAKVYYEPEDLVAYLERAYWEGFFDRRMWMKWQSFLSPYKIQPNYFNRLKVPFRKYLTLNGFFHALCNMLRSIGWIFAGAEATSTLPASFHWKDARHISGLSVKINPQSRFLFSQHGMRVLLPPFHSLFSFNQTAAEIFHLLFSHQTPELLSSLLASKYNQPIEVMQKDIAALFAAMSDAGVVS